MATRSASKRAKQTERVEPEGLTQQQVADLVGCAQGTVSKMIKRGEIDTLANGRIPESAVEAIREQWARDQRVGEETAALERRLLVAETEKEEALAKLNAMKLERESGNLIELAVVTRDGEATGERVLSVLRSIPQRCSMALECDCTRAAVVEVKISEEVERAVAELRESLYIKPPGE